MNKEIPQWNHNCGILRYTPELLPHQRLIDPIYLSLLQLKVFSREKYNLSDSTWGITCCWFFWKDDNHSLPQHERVILSLSYNSGRWISFAFSEVTILERVWGFKSCVSLRGFFIHVCYVILNQGFCRTCQYSLPDTMLQHDLNTTLNQIYIILITLFSMRYQSGGLVSPTYPLMGYWSMKGVFNFFLSVLVFNISI